MRNQNTMIRVDNVDNTQTTDRRGEIHIHNSWVFPQEVLLMTPQGVVCSCFPSLIKSIIIYFEFSPQLIWRSVSLHFCARSDFFLPALVRFMSFLVLSVGRAEYHLLEHPRRVRRFETCLEYFPPRRRKFFVMTEMRNISAGRNDTWNWLLESLLLLTAAALKFSNFKKFHRNNSLKLCEAFRGKISTFLCGTITSRCACAISREVNKLFLIRNG